MSATLIDRLPTVRGSYEAGAPLARYTWFRVGGPAEVLFRPADREDFLDFLANRPRDVPVTVIGVASNLLIRDGGLPGVTVRLGRAFSSVSVAGAEVTAGAAVLDANVAKAARDAGIAGLEFMIGVPGTVGGAVRMNAGAYGREIVDVLVSAEVADGAGTIQRMDGLSLGLSYRHSNLPEDWIVLGATFRGEPGETAAIARRMTEIQESREASQPIRMRTGGSTFANPTLPDGSRGKAWQLIDAAGCRGLRVGGAQVSEKHCNFLINTGEATAADLETLGETVRRRVFESDGVELTWEIRRLGVPTPQTATQGGIR